MSVIRANAIHANAILAPTRGCYPKWSFGGNYRPGNIVSYAVQQQETVQISCTPKVNGCSANGKKDVVQTMTYTWNWECISKYWCGAYLPSGAYTSMAWSQSSTPCEVS